MRPVALALLLGVCLLVGCAAPPVAYVTGASGGPLIPEQAALDVTAYRIQLAVDPVERRIDGTLTMTATLMGDIDRLVLDLDDRLTVEAVTVDGSEHRFFHEQGRLRVPLESTRRRGSELVAAVRYGGVPRVAPRPPWDGGFTWQTTADGRPWIATSCQGEGADLWWPCKDHPSDKPEQVDLEITVPSGLVVASNGTLRSTTTHADGTTTFHWHCASPISNYAVALNIAPYEALETSYQSVGGQTVPVVFYVLPESVEQGQAFLPQILDHLQWFEETLGPYPFRAEKYGVAQTPHLGMEHQTIIAYGNGFRPGTPEGYDWLHHHELSHEWWGNLVTCRDWRDMWIHEGFGTYMQALYLQDRFGAEAYQAEMARTRKRLANRRAFAPTESRDTHQIYFRPDGSHDNDIYDKASWMLHTLRWLLGDEAFFAGLRRMAYPTPELEQATDGSQVRLVGARDVVAVFEDAAGTNLDWFFTTYLRHAALPALAVTRQGDTLELAWTSPTGDAFPMPVPLVVDGVEQRVELPEGRATLTLPAGAQVQVDPDLRVLKAGDEAALAPEPADDAGAEPEPAGDAEAEDPPETAGG